MLAAEPGAVTRTVGRRHIVFAGGAHDTGTPP